MVSRPSPAATFPRYLALLGNKNLLPHKVSCEVQRCNQIENGTWVPGTQLQTRCAGKSVRS
jgi:hypothetical protein